LACTAAPETASHTAASRKLKDFYEAAANVTIAALMGSEPESLSMVIGLNGAPFPFHPVLCLSSLLDSSTNSELQSVLNRHLAGLSTPPGQAAIAACTASFQHCLDTLIDDGPEEAWAAALARLRALPPFLQELIKEVGELEGHLLVQAAWSFRADALAARFKAAPAGDITVLLSEVFSEYSTAAGSAISICPTLSALHASLLGPWRPAFGRPQQPG
jgi:hypothetical protein